MIALVQVFKFLGNVVQLFFYSLARFQKEAWRVADSTIGGRFHDSLSMLLLFLQVSAVLAVLAFGSWAVFFWSPEFTHQSSQMFVLVVFCMVTSPFQMLLSYAIWEPASWHFYHTLDSRLGD